MRLDVYHHFPAADDVLLSLARLDTLIKEVIVANKRIEDALGRIDAATTAVANEIRALKDQIGTGMSQTDVDAIGAQLEDKATKLEAIGSASDTNVQEVKAAAGG